MNNLKKIPLIENLRSLSDNYQGYILDLWGTVHNGIAPYEGVIETLQRLKSQGKHIVFLSNAPRRSHVVKEQLTRFDITPSLYDGLVTSGEIAYQLMQNKENASFPQLGRHMLMIGGLHDLDLYDGLDVELVTDVDKADFVLNTGPDQKRGVMSIEPYILQLKQCLERELPMICPNPDRVVVKGQQRQICAGALADYYRKHGGKVVEVGKPFPLVYDATMKLLKTDVQNTLAIGDSLATDITGAYRYGIDSLWLLGGIHQDLLQENEAGLLRACQQANVRPKAVMQTLRW